MDTEKQNRKSTRMTGFDYSSSRYYFITICTRDHRCLFGSVVSTEENGKMQLNRVGDILDKHIRTLDKRYPTVSVHQYVIMPNHLHMILLLDNGTDIPLTQIVGLFKSGVSKEIGFSVWQRSFHDHIIRNETDYKNIWNYINSNPAKWAMDKYYQREQESHKPIELSIDFD